MSKGYFELPPGAVDALAEHAEQAYPDECCGLVVRRADGQAVYWPCRNAAPEPGRQFVIEPRDWAAAEDAGELLAVCHSHPNASANPSTADRVMCERSGLPWIVIGWPSAVLKRVEPEGWRPALVGREFSYGVLDCYTLIRDYYEQELGVVLPDFDRAHDGWWKGSPGRAPLNLYRDGFAAAGFQEVSGPPQAHDVLLLQVASDVENHGAVYLGDGAILHHLYGRLSARDVYGGYWARATRAVLRHSSQLGGGA